MDEEVSFLRHFSTNVYFESRSAMTEFDRLFDLLVVALLHQLSYLPLHSDFEILYTGWGIMK